MERSEQLEIILNTYCPMCQTGTRFTYMARSGDMTRLANKQDDRYFLYKCGKCEHEIFKGVLDDYLIVMKEREAR